MFLLSQALDPERDVLLNRYDNEIPLACNVIYYMESLVDELLNATMRRLSGKILLNDPKIQPYPFRLQYVAQSDLDEKAIRSKLPQTYNEAVVAEAVGDLQHGLSDGQGGTLLARCLPTFSREGFFVDDNTLCTFPRFRLTTPENAEITAKLFAHEAAKRNFQRLTGVSYQDYMKAPASVQESRPEYSGSGMGFIVREKTKPEITADMLQHSEALSDWIGQNIQDDNEAISVLDLVLKRMRNKGKLKEPCKIEVKDKHIYLMLTKDERKDLSFRRGGIAKMLYVFYLIQIKRAEKDAKVPKCVAQVNLVDYKDDLLRIYQGIGPDWDAEMDSIKSVWEKGQGDFGNALSSIRKSINDIFDVDSIHPKCYSIEIMGNDKMGRSLYGIQLAPDDIKLGWPYDKLV